MHPKPFARRWAAAVMVAVLAAALPLWSMPVLAQATPPTAEPVIPDPEFDAAIPPLGPDDDPELGAPLESVEAFERRVAAPPPGQPEAAAAIPPGQDAELAAPLPPLDQASEQSMMLAQEAAAYLMPLLGEMGAFSVFDSVFVHDDSRLCEFSAVPIIHALVRPGSMR